MSTADSYTFRDSERYEQLVEEYMEGFREFRDGDWIQEKYYDLVYRIKGLIRYATAQCNCSKLLKVVENAKLERLVAEARKRVAIACSITDGEQDPDLVLAGKRLEDVVMQARGRRNEERSIETIHAKLLRST